MYHADLKQQKKNQLQFAVRRCLAGTGSWWETCGEILLKVHSSALLKRLGVAPRLGAEAAPLDKAWVKQEQELLQMVYSFSTYLASNVAWSQLMFKYTLPHGIACLASRSRNEREDATLLLEEMVLTLRKALEPKHSGNVGLQEILQDLAWHRQAFSAEVMAMLLKSDFDCHDEDLRSVAVELYSGSSTTKDCIESTFGHLRDAVARSTKNAKASQQLVWMYAQACKYPTTGGVPQIRATDEDWAKFAAGPESDRMRKLFYGCLDPKKTAMPTHHPGDAELPRNPDQVQKKKWKNAGPLSHQKSVASMAYLLTDVKNEFANAGMAWRSVFFTCGAIFWQSRADQFLLSLGVRKWGAIACRLTATEVDGEVFLCLDPSHQRQPDFLLNYSLSDSVWQRVQFELLPPACTPLHLDGNGICLLVISKMDLVKGAIKDGMSLTVEDLKHCCRALDIAPTTRSGKKGDKGGPVKIDWARALVEHYFADSSEEEQQVMLKGICGGKTLRSTDVEILDHVAELDPDNKQAFKKQIQAACESLDHLLQAKGSKQDAKSAVGRTAEERTEAAAKKAAQEKEKKEQAHRDHEAGERAERKAEVERQWNLTPSWLKELLPGEGEITGAFYAQYHPINEFFKTFYPVRAGEDPTNTYQSCQRKWGTARCPTKADALEVVIQFVYDRYNRLHPRNPKTMPSRERLLEYANRC